ncbi:CBS domain-containing protein [Bradyrhizobium sp. LHD-71]|uniref:CBS domain-containing protein n=1 Tax=Bradyrhizobium sp. LHD-71 TaxID=3072141 RepID=UPI00280E70AC|nr:CBS domain-containing protein [Bradyrhizobium sp. LHD-71]MDQ8730089.1 CBS domain-containing protein [Bradyrhizobium sp. LHD-71]
MRTSVATVTPDTRLIDAARLLLETNQRALPVVDRDGQLVGIISEGDFLNRAELDIEPRRSWLDGLLQKASAQVAHNRSLFVGRVMTPAPICVDPDAPLDDVVALMDIHGVAQIPVTEAGSLLGLISRVELIAAVERRLRMAEDSTSTTPGPA